MLEELGYKTKSTDCPRPCVPSSHGNDEALAPGRGDVAQRKQHCTILGIYRARFTGVIRFTASGARPRTSCRLLIFRLSARMLISAGPGSSRQRNGTITVKAKTGAAITPAKSIVLKVWWASQVTRIQASVRLPGRRLQNAPHPASPLVEPSDRELAPLQLTGRSAACDT